MRAIPVATGFARPLYAKEEWTFDETGGALFIKFSEIISFLKSREFGFLVAGAVLAGAGGIVALESLHYTSSPEFCMSCHEMRVVGEQGWMRSPHYRNDAGVAAECTDCHVPPETELYSMVWVKSRDGLKDVFLHFFGESDPHRMEWDELQESARHKVRDSSCLSCHKNLTARGLSLKVIMAHREYQRMDDLKCVHCHTEEFHGRFRQYLNNRDLARQEGGER
ncbi:MAG: NapC/NirT family cytochrome c [bacterium]